MRELSLSLILCTYGRTAELTEMFRSLAAQDFKDFEVIVVDQNEDARLVPYLEKAVADGLAIRHVKHSPPNLSTARNVGIALAHGRWIGFPDDDCWYESDLLSQLSERFERDDALTGAVACWPELNESPDLPTRFTWEQTRQFRDRLAVSFTLFFNRKLFDRIGCFDSRFGVGHWFGAGEETDFFMRAMRAGADVTFHPAARVHHPMKSYGPLAEARKVIRERARGTGALYAKQGLPFWVVARGLSAPVLRPLFTGGGKRDFVLGGAAVLGRLEGLWRWKRLNYDSVDSRPFESVGEKTYFEEVPLVTCEAVSSA
jgi:glycosyltransferase involved in cell wall biosynthesis